MCTIFIWCLLYNTLPIKRYKRLKFYLEVTKIKWIANGKATLEHPQHKTPHTIQTHKHTHTTHAQSTKHTQTKQFFVVDDCKYVFVSVLDGILIEFFCFIFCGCVARKQFIHKLSTAKG